LLSSFPFLLLAASFQATTSVNTLCLDCQYSSEMFNHITSPPHFSFFTWLILTVKIVDCSSPETHSLPGFWTSLVLVVPLSIWSLLFLHLPLPMSEVFAALLYSLSWLLPQIFMSHLVFSFEFWAYISRYLLQDGIMHLKLNMLHNWSSSFLSYGNPGVLSTHYPYSSPPHLCFSLYIQSPFSFFCGTRIETRGLVLGMQELYHFSHTYIMSPSPLFLLQLFFR
jgi:hypothetical protein